MSYLFSDVEHCRGRSMQRFHHHLVVDVVVAGAWSISTAKSNII